MKIIKRDTVGKNREVLNSIDQTYNPEIKRMRTDPFDETQLSTVALESESFEQKILGLYHKKTTKRVADIEPVREKNGTFRIVVNGEYKPIQILVHSEIAKKPSIEFAKKYENFSGTTAKVIIDYTSQ